VRHELGLPTPAGVTDGNGFAFVSHIGDVQPSGFLPLTVGNVRARPLSHWYREHPLFRALRDPGSLRGRCGRCEHRGRCGGSRAAAYAATGDPFGEDPGCVHEPGTRREPVPARSAPTALFD
jgi:radical SAM protein with 4Fe4S-binding SPASM domain